MFAKQELVESLWKEEFFDKEENWEFHTFAWEESVDLIFWFSYQAELLYGDLFNHGWVVVFLLLKILNYQWY